LAIDPKNSSTLYAAALGGVFKSSNGGTSWEKTGLPLSYNSFAPHNILAIDPQNPKIIYTAYNADNGPGILKSTDGASTWSVVNSGLSATYVSFLAIDPQNPITIYAGTSVGLVKTTNGGANWQAVDAGLPAGYGVKSLVIDPKESSSVYAGIPGPWVALSGQRGGGVFKSSDGGVSWSVPNAGPGTGFFDGALAIDPQNPSNLYASGFDCIAGCLSNVSKSKDGGASWTTANLGPGAGGVLAIDPQEPSTLYAGGGMLFKSADGGATWCPLALPQEPRPECEECLPVVVLAIDPQSTSTVYAGGSGGVFKSTDGGASWNAVIPSPYVSALVIDQQDSNTVYASIGAEVFKSTDGATTWSRAKTGLKTTFVTTLAIDPRNPNTVYAGTAGGGIFVITFASEKQ
jgi:photosystem II stability/assembly factor-like uncharacterized protein